MTKTKETYNPYLLVHPAYNPIEKIDRAFDRPVILCIMDIPKMALLPKDSLNVYLDCCEPSFRCPLNEIIKERTDLDLILTTNLELLENSPCKSVLFPFGTCWVKNTNEKEFGVSFLITAPTGHDGYDIRHNIWDSKDEIKIPKKFYNSSNRPKMKYETVGGVPTQIPLIDEESIGDKQTDKEKLFDTMFSIAIENTREPYYFSEKLIDCLQSKTVPIYYGCSRLSEFFNMDGVIVVNNAQEIKDICNSLTPKDYEKRKDAIEENYLKSIEFARPFYERVFDIIEKELKLKSTKL